MKTLQWWHYLMIGVATISICVVAGFLATDQGTPLEMEMAQSYEVEQMFCQHSTFYGRKVSESKKASDEKWRLYDLPTGCNCWLYPEVGKETSEIRNDYTGGCNQWHKDPNGRLTLLR